MPKKKIKKAWWKSKKDDHGSNIRYMKWDAGWWSSQEARSVSVLVGVPAAAETSLRLSAVAGVDFTQKNENRWTVCTVGTI